MSKINNSVKQDHEPRHSQLNNRANEQIQHNVGRSIPLSKQEALIKQVKFEEIQRKGALDTSENALDELNTSDSNDNLETNVKQEEVADSKVVFHDGTSNSRRQLSVKMGRPAKRRCIRQNHLQPNVNDPNFHCSSYKDTFRTSKTYRRHLRRFHKMKLKSLQSPKDLDVLPDYYDPNRFCKSCDRTYKSRLSYRVHCRNVHELKAPERPIEVPDINDPNNYCKIHNHSYKNKYGYTTHCMMMHNVKPAEIKPTKSFANPEATPDINDADNYCSICDRTFCRRASFRTHLFNIHSILPPPPKINTIKPDFNNPNNYCRSCDKTLSTNHEYRRHLSAAHSIGKTHIEDDTNPDVDDRNNYCRVCQKSYSSRTVYQRHLQGAHRLVIPIQRRPSDLPDPYDSNFYCRVCKTSKKSLSKYREHCIRVHRMVLNRFTILNPSATIDVMIQSLIAHSLSIDMHPSVPLRCIYKLFIV